MGRLVSGAAVVIAVLVLLLQPLTGYPQIVRLPAILLPLAIVFVISARPWRWDDDQWRAVDTWQPSAAVVWRTAAVAFVVLFWIVLTRFRAGDINAADFTIYFDRPLYQTLHGRPLFVETADLVGFSHRSELAVHAYWALLPIAALYAIRATPLWLLALSVLAVVLGAVRVFRILQRLGTGSVLAAATAAAFVLNANTARALMYGFHPELLYAWFIPWALDAAFRRARLEFIVATRRRGSREGGRGAESLRDGGGPAARTRASPHGSGHPALHRRTGCPEPREPRALLPLRASRAGRIERPRLRRLLGNLRVDAAGARCWRWRCSRGGSSARR